MYIHGENLDYALLSGGPNTYGFEWVSCWNLVQNISIFQFFLKSLIHYAKNVRLNALDVTGIAGRYSELWAFCLGWNISVLILLLGCIVRCVWIHMGRFHCRLTWTLSLKFQGETCLFFCFFFFFYGLGSEPVYLYIFSCV